MALAPRETAGPECGADAAKCLLSVFVGEENLGHVPGPAADIQHHACRQFVGEAQVEVQVVTLPVEGVVDSRQARMSEDRVRRPPTLYLRGTGPL